MVSKIQFNQDSSSPGGSVDLANLNKPSRLSKGASVSYESSSSIQSAESSIEYNQQ